MIKTRNYLTHVNVNVNMNFIWISYYYYYLDLLSSLLTVITLIIHVNIIEQGYCWLSSTTKTSCCSITLTILLQAVNVNVVVASTYCIVITY